MREGGLDQQGLRDRRRRVLSSMLDGLSQAEIAEHLKVSQPTISRDMQVLDKEAEERSHFFREMEFKSNIIWQAYNEFDGALKRAFADCDGIDPSNLKERHDALRVVMGLLGRKAFLLTYMGCDPRDEQKDSLIRQFHALKKTFEEFGTRLQTVSPKPTGPAEASEVA